MNRQILVLLGLAIIKIALSLPVEEKIDPVDLKYYCVTVATADEKATDKIPVLLIHGLTGNHKAWDGTDLTIARRTQRKVCSIDLRNHGESPWNNRTDIKAFVADIGHFLDKQGMKKVNIISHSLGGKVAVHYTLNNPTRVNSLVVEDAPPNGFIKEAYDESIVKFKIYQEALAELPTTGNEEEAQENFVNIVNQKIEKMGITGKMTVKDVRSLELKLVDGKWRFNYNLDALAEAMKDPNAFLVESTGLYTGPTLFIYGAESIFRVGDHKENILKLFPKAKLVPVEGAGHFIHGHFRQYDDEVVKLLSEVD